MPDLDTAAPEVDFSDDAPESVIATMEDEIKAVVEKLRDLIANAGASRPLAVAHTKAEEAIMWVDKHFAEADAAG